MLTSCQLIITAVRGLTLRPTHFNPLDVIIAQIAMWTNFFTCSPTHLLLVPFVICMLNAWLIERILWLIPTSRDDIRKQSWDCLLVHVGECFVLLFLEVSLQNAILPSRASISLSKNKLRSWPIAVSTCFKGIKEQLC